jgi:hypothetical protein
MPDSRAAAAAATCAAQCFSQGAKVAIKPLIWGPTASRAAAHGKVESRRPSPAMLYLLPYMRTSHSLRAAALHVGCLTDPLQASIERNLTLLVTLLTAMQTRSRSSSWQQHLKPHMAQANPFKHHDVLLCCFPSPPQSPRHLQPQQDPEHHRLPALPS